jgi:hypothetical protein
LSESTPSTSGAALISREDTLRREGIRFLQFAIVVVLVTGGVTIAQLFGFLKFPPVPEGVSPFVHFIFEFFIQTGGIGIAIIFIWVAYRFMAASGVTSENVIPLQERELLEELIRGNKRDEARIYIELSSLRGFTGTFTKLGISGLPLATIFLTIVFALMAASVGGSTGGTFLDLAKLTLGAFIGSFVQRSVETRATVTGNR